MATKRDTNDTCPICQEETLRHAHCSYASCTFRVTTCPRCDREQAVDAFVADHEKDCAQGPALIPAAPSATFVAPRRAA